MKDQKIKYAIEEFIDKPAPWNDDEIDEYMKKSMWNFFTPNVIWCYNNEKLFDNPCKCKTFVAIPLKKGYIRIKYAYEKTMYVPYHWDKKYIEDIIRHSAEHQNGRSFIWCYGDQELFAED